MNAQKTTFRRDKAHGKVLGVCAGLENYSDISAFWWRLALIVLTLTTGGLVLVAYLALGLLTEDKDSSGGGV